jgi:hypothetical protein
MLHCCISEALEIVQREYQIQRYHGEYSFIMNRCRNRSHFGYRSFDRIWEHNCQQSSPISMSKAKIAVIEFDNTSITEMSVPQRMNEVQA